MMVMIIFLWKIWRKRNSDLESFNTLKKSKSTSTLGMKDHKTKISIESSAGLVTKEVESSNILKEKKISDTDPPKQSSHNNLK